MSGGELRPYDLLCLVDVDMWTADEREACRVSRESNIKSQSEERKRAFYAGPSSVCDTIVVWVSRTAGTRVTMRTQNNLQSGTKDLLSVSVRVCEDKATRLSVSSVNCVSCQRCGDRVASQPAQKVEVKG